MTGFHRYSWLTRGAIAFVAILGIQCAAGSSGPRILPDPDGASPRFEMPGESLETQRLFRVRYEGQEGRGGMKLVLKLASESSFQVSTTDSIGRPLWSLQASDGETLLIDHRGRQFCAGEDVRLPDPVLEAMPWPSLPRVLLGFLPTMPQTIARSSAEEIEYQSLDGRRWTARLDSGRPLSWVLWEGERPVLWWSRQGAGGMLSHRQGIQIRWREVVSEPLRGPLVDLQVPSGYQPAVCDASHLP